MPEYVAVMVTLPLVRAVTSPLDDTVATAEFEDDHVAVLDTSCVVPFSIVAVAANCDAVPTAGMVPDTATVETVVAVFGLSLHAPMVNPSASTKRTITNERTFMVAPCVVRRWPLYRHMSLRPSTCGGPVAKVRPNCGAGRQRRGRVVRLERSSPPCGSGSFVPFWSLPSERFNPIRRTLPVCGC